jgi:hypothetical protein
MKIAHVARRAAMFLACSIILSLTTAAVAQVEPRPARKGRTYKVRIDSAPQQAAIYLDDKKYGIVGYTPWEGSLVKGQWKVIVEKEGYEPVEKVISVARTRKVQETYVPLAKKVDPARVDVRADADKNAFGAQIWLDGQMQGDIPLVVTVTQGRHLIEIKKEGFEVFTQWVEIKEGEKVTVNPFLREIKKAKKGSILVEADVPAGEVYIDGNKHADPTPTLIADLVEGPHVVEIRKEPAVPWKQTITVVADQTVKVSATLKATLGGPGGSIRVLSNVDKAKVFLDGNDMGPAPIDIKDVRTGEHVVEVKAPGYVSREERVVVNAGSAAVLKLDLTAGGDDKDAGTIKVVSPVPEADVFIDGAAVGKVPQEKQVTAGEHFVVVSRTGYAKLEQKVRVEPGQTITVSAELKSVGLLRVISTPAGADVLINGVVAGKTPLDKDTEVGETVVTVRYPDYYDFEKTLKIEGGKDVALNARLERIDTGPTAGEVEREQRSLSSFGARTLPKGRSTIDFGVGYPYYHDLNITVGAGGMANFGFDAGIQLKGFFNRTDLSLHARLMLADAEPFSFAVFSSLGYGSTVFVSTERNGVDFDVGAIASLTALSHVTVSGRMYAEMWTDRHCPTLDDPEFSDKASDTCKGYKARVIDGMDPGDFSVSDQARVEKLTGESGDGVFDREGGARLMTSLIVEIAVEQRWNLWLLFEGAAFQEERALLTDKFSSSLFDKDRGTYFELGATYKF